MKRLESRSHIGVRVSVEGREADKQIASLIRELRIAGIDSLASCDVDIGSRVRIQFADAVGAKQFINIVAEYEFGDSTLYARITGWSPPADAWQFFIEPWDSALDEDRHIPPGTLPEWVLDLSLLVTVRFLPEGLPEVLRRVRQHNRAIGLQGGQRSGN